MKIHTYNEDAAKKFFDSEKYFMRKAKQGKTNKIGS